MGRAPLFLLSFALIGLAACEAEPPPQVPPPPPAGKIDDAPARDAGDASREAIERASETLRKLGAAAIAARSSSRADTRSEPPPAAPVEEARPVAPEPVDGSERDASAAAAEATEKFVEVTKRAVETVRSTGKELVEALRDEPKAPAPE